MNALIDRISSDPNLLSAAVFGGALLVITVMAMLWFTLFQKDERRMHRRMQRVQSPARARHKRLLPNLDLMRLRLERSGLPLNAGDYSRSTCRSGWWSVWACRTSSWSTAPSGASGSSPCSCPRRST
jgi:hypothetical protein